MQRSILLCGFLSTSFLYASETIHKNVIWEQEAIKAKIIKTSELDTGVFKVLQTCYECEFAPITKSLMDCNGNYDQDEIRSHWGKHHDVFIFYIDQSPAGFCVVNQGSMINAALKDDTNVHDIAEFFIAPIFRKKHWGEIFAHAIFNLYKGKWEVRQLPELENTARFFWNKVIRKITNNSFVEIKNHPQWQGFVQQFTID